MACLLLNQLKCKVSFLNQIIQGIKQQKRNDMNLFKVVHLYSNLLDL